MHHNDYWNYYYNNNGYVPLPNIRYVPIIDYPRPPHPPPPSFYYPPPEQHYYNSRYNYPNYRNPNYYPNNYYPNYYHQNSMPKHNDEYDRNIYSKPNTTQDDINYRNNSNYKTNTYTNQDSKKKYTDEYYEGKIDWDKNEDTKSEPINNSKDYNFSKNSNSDDDSVYKKYSPFFKKSKKRKSFGSTKFNNDLKKSINFSIKKKTDDEIKDEKMKLIEDKLDEIKKSREKIQSKLFNLVLVDPLKTPTNLDKDETKKTKSFGTSTDDDNNEAKFDFSKLFSRFGKPKESTFGSSLYNSIKSDEEEDDSDYTLEYVDEKLDCLDDLIDLGKKYEDKYKKEKTKYNIQIKTLSKLVEPLTKLKNLIGLETVKKQVYELVIYYLQKLDNKNKDMLHTVIEGPPGVGKTELAKILASVFKSMGILSKGTFKVAKRNDFVGGYLGQTTIKTQKLLDSCKGGVLFIDEAYSLGNNEGRDSYSKECIDAITAFLTEERSDFICIIAGYKESLEKCFFNYNAGLERRFPYRFKLDKYSPEDLRSIFLKIVKDNDWSIESDKEVPVKFFEKNIKYFKFNGGDMETLFHKCKIAHSKRMLYCKVELRKIINNQDLTEGMKLFLENDDVKKRNETDDWSLNGLYT